MEAPLIYINKAQTGNGEMREWQIVNPLKSDIRVDESQIPTIFKNSFFTFALPSEVIYLLTNIANAGGLWEGWTLCAIGYLMHVSDPFTEEQTLAFPVVFKKKRTAEEEEKERRGEGFEMVGAKGGLRDEDIEVVLEECTPATPHSWNLAVFDRLLIIMPTIARDLPKKGPNTRLGGDWGVTHWAEAQG